MTDTQRQFTPEDVRAFAAAAGEALKRLERTISMALGEFSESTGLTVETVEIDMLFENTYNVLIDVGLIPKER